MIEQRELDRFAKLAPLMQTARVRDPLATLSYCMLADAVHWSDEYPQTSAADGSKAHEQAQTLWTLRIVLRHRTCLILKIDSPLGEYWNLGRSLFGDWVGFAYDRVNPDDADRRKIEELVRRGEKELRRMRVQHDA